jgi:pyruvate kinase
VTSGLKLVCPTDAGDDPVAVGDLPAVEQAHRVHHGDQIVLTRSLEPAVSTGGGTPHSIGCGLADAFDHARPGERVWLDDGKIGGTIDRVDNDEIALTVTDVRPGGANLRAARGSTCPRPISRSRR